MSARGYRAPASAAATPLSPRQQEVLRLVAQGLSDKEIAAALEISESAVGKRVCRLLRRYDVPNRAGLVRFAIQQGLLDSQSAAGTSDEARAAAPRA